MKILYEDLQNPEKTTIRIEGIEQKVKLMHITDSHFVRCDERDPEARQSTEKYQEMFQALTPGRTPPFELFSRALERSKALGAECTVLTGDIIHFPSWAGLDAVEEGLEGLGTPFLYTLGNHDWFFPYHEWSDEVRASFYPRFHHLTRGNPACQAVELGGVRLVALDNSNYQVSQAQLDFLQQQLQSGQPCLLFVHIPLCTPALTPAVMERWEAPIMLGSSVGWSAAGRKRIRARENDASTLACHQLLTSGAVENLAGIFCGHVHLAHAGEFSPGRFQYVTRPCFEGGYRTIEIGPCS